MAMWGGEPPYAYDDDEGIDLWTLAVILVAFALIVIAGVLSAGGPS